MNNKIKLLIASIAILAFGCNHSDQQVNNLTITPEAGTSYKAGDAVKVNIGNAKADSVVYLLDSVKFLVKKDTSGITLKTDTMKLGIKLITARAYQNGKLQEVSTNIVLMAAKAPEELTYHVEKVYPHDTSAYTEGLLYQDGFLYESTGGEQSSLRKVDLATGKVVQQVKLDKKYFAEHQVKLDKEYFGEGISIIGDKILMLSYKQPEIAIVFDKNTFKLLSTFINNVGQEGWGMTFDGSKLYFDDSTNRVWFLDRNTYRQIGFIDVYTDKAPVDSVNELEYINGKIYSNIYQRDTIVIIDPKTGAVLQRVDMKNLWPKKDRPAGFDDDGNNVLNGIAWDEKGQRLFVTGKKWPHLYQVKFVPKK